MKHSILEETYELIKSLNKSERRYFRLYTKFQSGDKSYLKLFDIIDKQKEFNEKNIIEKFLQHHKAHTLPVIKKYLFDQLIASLKSYGAYKDLDSDHTDLIETYKVLHYKGLYGQAERLLYKTKSVTWADDAFIRHYYVLLLEYYQELYHTTDLEASRLKEIFEERRLTLNIIQNYSWVGDIFSYQRIMLRKHLYCRTKQQKDALTKLIAPLLKSGEADMLSRTALGMRNMALCDYYMAIGKPEKAIKTSRSYLDLRINAGSADKIEMQTLAEYAMHLNLCTRSRIYDDFEENLNRYNSLTQGIRNKEKFALSYERWLLYTLVYLLHVGNFDDASKLLEKEKKKLQELDKSITKKTRISIWYFAAYLQYALQEFKGSLKFIQKILSEANNEVEEYIFAKLLLMFIHYDLKNFDLLEYQIRSTRRLMEKKEKYYECEKVLFDFFKDTSEVDSARVQQQKMENLRQKVESLFRISQEKGFLYYFDIQSWIEGKIKNEAFAKVVAHKESNRKFTTPLIS